MLGVKTTRAAGPAGSANPRDLSGGRRAAQPSPSGRASPASLCRAGPALERVPSGLKRRSGWLGRGYLGAFDVHWTRRGRLRNRAVGHPRNTVGVAPSFQRRVSDRCLPGFRRGLRDLDVRAPDAGDRSARASGPSLAAVRLLCGFPEGELGADTDARRFALVPILEGGRTKRAVEGLRDGVDRCWALGPISVSVGSCSQEGRRMDWNKRKQGLTSAAILMSAAARPRRLADCSGWEIEAPTSAERSRR